MVTFCTLELCTIVVDFYNGTPSSDLLVFHYCEYVK